MNTLIPRIQRICSDYHFERQAICGSEDAIEYVNLRIHRIFADHQTKCGSEDVDNFVNLRIHRICADRHFDKQAMCGCRGIRQPEDP